MDENKTKGTESDEMLDKEYGRHELITIIFVTVVVLLAWSISSDVMEAIIGEEFEMYLNQSSYLYSSMLLTLVLTFTIMKTVGQKVIQFFINIVNKIRKKEEMRNA